MQRVALIAGASSGLGRAVAQGLAGEGYRTYAGARSFADAKAASEKAPQGCVPLALDVTSDASVTAAVEAVVRAEGRVDVLVNCAAILMLGSCEETGDAELRAVLETNVLGMARMTRAVLPQMRRQGKGHIIQFSSLNGLFGIPFQGAYTASKHAVEGWSESLAMEAGRHGVSVTLIEPGDCRSGSGSYRLRASASKDAASPYTDRYESAVRRIEYDETNGMDPKRVARAVVRVLQRRRPPARAVVARLDQRLALWLHGLLPGRWFFRIIQTYYAARTPVRRQK